MNYTLTDTEEEFLKYLKKELFLTRINIVPKVPLLQLTKQRSLSVPLTFKEEQLLSDVVIDFVLYENDQPLAGIEIIDEPEELTMSQGEKMLKETIFFRLGYHFFCFEELNDLKTAAHKVKTVVKEKQK